MLSTWYQFLVVIRFALIFVPQTGYIHPDEFFQGPEIAAGQVFNLNVTTSWEFGQQAPVRSVLFPVLMCGTPYVALDYLKDFAKDAFKLNLLTPYYLLVAPRIMMGVLSLAVDWSLYHICKTHGQPTDQCLVTLASSYSMLTFVTRTFSNSLETVIFSVLLAVIVRGNNVTSKMISQLNVYNLQLKAAINMKQRVGIKRSMSKIKKSFLKTDCLLGGLIAFGFFNRPSFLLFAALPVTFWVFRAGYQMSSPITYMLGRLSTIASCFLIISNVFVFVDSIYYGSLNLDNIQDGLSVNNITLTPLNFVLYNSNRNNLASHGLHPRYLHLLVNLPVLFGLVGIVCVYRLFLVVRKVIQRDMSGVSAIRCFMFPALVAPLVLFSLVPHQEARFLLPLLVPVVCLTYDFLYRGSRWWRRAWYISNLLLLIVFGFLHQGGVVPTLDYLHTRLPHPDSAHRLSIVYAQTYSPPQFLLLNPSKRIKYSGRVRYLALPPTQLHDLKGISMPALSRYLLSLWREELWLQSTKKTKPEILLVIPGALEKELELRKDARLNFLKMKSVWPHLSTEHLHKITYWTSVYGDGMSVRQGLTLNVYKVLYSSSRNAQPM